jgi:hypothetical protein
VNFVELLKRLEIPSEFHEAMSAYAAESVATLPQGPIEFLDPATVRLHHEYARLSDELQEPLVGLATRIDGDPLLRLLCWHLHQCIFLYDAPIDKWPECIPCLGDDSGLLFMLCVLAMIPAMQETHEAMKIPPTISRDTCLQIRAFNEAYKIRYDGLPGTPVSKLMWLRQHPRGKIFRVGRFEFRLIHQPAKVQCWRHDETGETLLFMPPGLLFDADGFVAPTGSGQARWQSTLDEDDSTICGTVASPLGMAMSAVTTIEKSVWRRVLGPEDYVLDLHIPEGGGMTPAVVAESLRAVFKFFDTCFPDVRPLAVQCRSWIFNTQLETHLAGSNLASFMREVYLFPVMSSGDDGLLFIFCRDYDDWTLAPRETRLQRALLDLYCGGTPLRCGGMVFLREDLGRFGEQVYRGSLL